MAVRGHIAQSCKMFEAQASIRLFAIASVLSSILNGDASLFIPLTVTVSVRISPMLIIRFHGLPLRLS